MRSLKISRNFTERKFTSIDKYLADINKIPLLNTEEEVDLSERIKKGDTLALEKLVKGNLRFVVSVAKQYQHYGLTLGDLINEGNVGLIKAAHRFDPSRGFKFISYAVWWIRQSILMAVSEQSRIVRLPANRLTEINKINKAASHLEQKLERAPSTDELSSTLNLSVEEITSILRKSGKHVSIDEPLGHNDENSLSDLLPGNYDEAPDFPLYSDSLKMDIQRALVNLSKKKGMILSCYFGLDGNKPESLEEIGIKLKLTRERVRQLKDQALKELRQTPIMEGFKDYICR